MEDDRVPSLRELRLRKMWSQRDLARRRCHAEDDRRSGVGRVEPHLKTMRKLAAALGVEPLEIDEFRKAIEEKVAA